MPRTYDPARTCLHVRDWPLDDRRLWSGILATGTPEDETRGIGAAWRPTTVESNRKGYGRWLNYLIQSDVDLDIPTADRVTPERVSAYRQELEDQGLKPQSRCNRMSELYSVISAFAPEYDWDWLKRRCHRLNSIADEERRQEPPTLLTGDILARALTALDTARPSGVDRRLVQAIAYRNWLMVATLCLMPLRRHNMASLSITRHLRCDSSGWTVKFPAGEMKTNRAFAMPVPPLLRGHLQYYFDRVRPALLAGQKSDRFWISFHHTEMDDHAVGIAMTNFTRQVFGEAIRPHRYRHMGATSVVVAAPEMLEAASAFLGHDDPRTTRDIYILGASLAASRTQGQLVAMLRDRIVDPGEQPRS